jgi:glycosyltransferase involved in cell wall biosynthesis
VPALPTTTVTVIVPCFNEVDHIEACLRDLFEQDYPPPCST